MRTLLLIAVAAILLFVAFCWPNELYHDRQHDRKAESRATLVTIEASGKILGVGVGTTIEEAREKLDSLRDPTSTGFRDKKRSAGGKGEKAYWRLRGTEFSWIMAWANKEGRIVRLSIAVPTEKPKPFAEVGDLSRATTNQEHVATWNVSRPNKLSYRLVARGPNRRATNIYLTATELEQ